MKKLLFTILGLAVLLTGAYFVNADLQVETAKPAIRISETCPENWVKVPGSSTYGTTNFCVMKYEASNDGSGNAISDTATTPWAEISQLAAITECSDIGGHLITNNEWMTIARNVEQVASNWSGGSVGTGYIYSGHNDGTPASALIASTDDDGYYGTGQTTGNQKRTLTLDNGETIWDVSGNAWEWTDDTLDCSVHPIAGSPV